MMVLLLAFGLLGPVQGECHHVNWKEGDPIVLSDVAPCLRQENIREEVERRALSGDRSAASLLADFYMEGTGDDDAQAIRWLRVYSKLSASQPVALAQLLLKSPTPLDQQEGVEILQSKANAGDESSAALLADFFSSTGRVVEAMAWYEFAAVRGHVNSMIKLGDLLLERQDQPSRSMGVLWTLVAANKFQDGTFRSKQLKERAAQSAAKFGLELETISKFAKTIKPG